MWNVLPLSVRQASSTGLETNGSQLISHRLVEIPFWVVSFALSVAIFG